MLLEFGVSLFLGMAVGIFTGLFPSLHINLIASIISGFTIVGNEFRLGAIVFVVALSITHTFLDFIPSIFLGAPESDNFLAILPGHELLLEGKGIEAVYYALFGALFGIIGFFLFLPGLFYGIPVLFEFVKSSFFVILFFISGYLILREKNIFLGCIIFLFSGILGFLAFNLEIKQPLLPLLSGLFGVSSLLLSLNSKQVLPKQERINFSDLKIEKGTFFLGIFSLFVCPFFSFLPGIGAGHASIFISEIKNATRKGFIFINGLASSFIMASSFLVVYLIEKARTGSAAFVYEFGKIEFGLLVLILMVILFSSVCSFFIGLYVIKRFLLFFNRINYFSLSSFVLLVILIVNIIFSNLFGLMVLFCGASLGVLCSVIGVRKINLMGALLLPSIIYYFI